MHELDNVDYDTSINFSHYFVFQNPIYSGSPKMSNAKNGYYRTLAKSIFNMQNNINAATSVGTDNKDSRRTYPTDVMSQFWKNRFHLRPSLVLKYTSLQYFVAQL